MQFAEDPQEDTAAAEVSSPTALSGEPEGGRQASGGAPSQFVDREKVPEALEEFRGSYAEAQDAFKRELKCGVACVKHPRYVLMPRAIHTPVPVRAASPVLPWQACGVC